MGLYLGWLVARGALSEEFKEDFADEVEDFKARRITAPRLMEIMDGALANDMMTPPFAFFSENYYQGGQYDMDYSETW